MLDYSNQNIGKLYFYTIFIYISPLSIRLWVLFAEKMYYSVVISNYSVLFGIIRYYSVLRATPTIQWLHLVYSNCRILPNTSLNYRIFTSRYWSVDITLPRCCNNSAIPNHTEALSCYVRFSLKHLVHALFIQQQRFTTVTTWLLS